MKTLRFRRDAFSVLVERLREPRRFMQVLTGPRQVGKTTLAQQAASELACPVHYASADSPTLQSLGWLDQQWEVARTLAADHGEAVLVLDEIQKIPRWSDLAKSLWDSDTRTPLNLKVVILGSAPLLIAQGLSESLAGRFETLALGHWSYSEMRSAFAWSLDQYIAFGGYPGAASLIDDHERWARYIMDSLIETSVSRDVLLLNRVDKPALLRRLFELACSYSGQVLSYTKMLGQLQDAGNTTTLAHYLHLLSAAGLVAGLDKFAGDKARMRGSSPKLQVLNTALMTAPSGLGLTTLRQSPALWGRLVESCVGAHCLSGAQAGHYELSYWRDGDQEVDFVMKRSRKLIAIEVKSQPSAGSLSGMEAFQRQFKPDRALVIGPGHIPVERFLSASPQSWFT